MLLVQDDGLDANELERAAPIVGVHLPPKIEEPIAEDGYLTDGHLYFVRKRNVETEKRCERVGCNIVGIEPDVRGKCLCPVHREELTRWRHEYKALEVNFDYRGASKKRRAVSKVSDTTSSSSYHCV